MPEISLRNVDRLQFTAMKLESITYLQQLMFEDNDGWIKSSDPECFKKDNAADLLFSLQRDTVETLHTLLFNEAFV